MTDTCTGGTVACWISSQANLLNNIANNLLPVERLITGAAYLIGCAFIFKGIYCLKQYGEQRTIHSSSTNAKEPITFLLVGAMLIYFPMTFATFMQSTFGYRNVLQYAPVNSGNSTLEALFGSGSIVGRPLTIIIQVIGLISFVRGWVLIARAASSGAQPGATGKGLIHIFGGILAVNIIGTLEMINNTLYGV